jgi:hypothetical protein
MEDEEMKSQLATLGSTMVVLGIIFGGTDRLIGYSFIGAGLLLAVVQMISSRRNA